MSASHRPQLIIPAALLADILVETYRQFPLETGGILLGHNDGAMMAVSVVVGPGPGATHRRLSFDPDQSWQERAVADAWQSAGRDLDYLGDWHTHPNGTPQPSKLDVAALRTIRDSPDARVAAPIMLIVGATESGSVALRAHLLGRHRRGSSAEVRVECGEGR